MARLYNYLRLPKPLERGVRERPPLPKLLPPGLRLVVLLPEGLRVLPPKPEPVARLPVLVFGTVRRTVEEPPGYDLLIVPVLRKAVRFLSTAGGAL